MRRQYSDNDSDGLDPRPVTDIETLRLRENMRMAAERRGLLPPRTHEEKLEDEYGIDAGMPFSARIEMLYGDQGLSAEEIANVLEVELSVVQGEIVNVEAAIVSAGSGGTAEDRVRKRGIYILQLERQLGLMNRKARRKGETDPQLISRIAQVTSLIVKMRGLETEKKEEEAARGLDFGTSLEAAINKLDRDTVAALRNRLRFARR